MSDYKYCPLCASVLEKKEINNISRNTCPSKTCNFIHWDNPLPVVAGIVEYKGEVLLARNALWPEKMFSVITGFLEKNEEPENGILRELKEELGLDGKIVEFVGLYSFSQLNQVIMAYHIEATGEIKLGDEIAEVKSIPISKLKSWPVGTGPAVKDWLEKRRGD